jgi:hypothetical protein
MMPTALVGGAAAAHGSAGGRRTSGHVRVLKGYSITGTQKKELKKGYSSKQYYSTKTGCSKRELKKAVLQKRYAKRVAQKWVRKKGTKKGYSKEGTQIKGS